MVRHRLPPEHAGPARAYLIAFLDEAEAADAMHEVAADAAYWGDDTLTKVLAVTHGVLLSRARVSAEASTAWLVEELGLTTEQAEAIIRPR